MFKLGEPVHGVLDAERQVGNHKLILRARQIRLARGGIKDGLVSALVALIVDSTAVHSDWVTVDEADDRFKFIKALYGTGNRGQFKDGKLSEDITSAFPQKDFEQEMMLWSRALYPRFIGASSGGYEEADAEPSAPRWSVPGLVLRGLPSIWFGDAKANKSTLMRLTCQSLAYGVDRLIPVREQAKVIWVNAEEDPGEHRRQFGNVNEALGLPKRTAPTFVIHARGMGINDLAQRLERAVMETGAEHVFIDSLSRMAQGLSLNDNQTATLLMDALGGLPCSVNWIGHTGQENTHRLAGSKHFTNAARLMVRVQSRMSFGGVSPELKRGVRATVTDANGAAPVDPMFWTFEYHRDYGLLRARPSESNEWPVLHCDALVGEAKTRECRRKTWDGVLRSGAIRCPSHRGMDDET